MPHDLEGHAEETRRDLGRIAIRRGVLISLDVGIAIRGLPAPPPGARLARPRSATSIAATLLARIAEHVAQPAHIRTGGSDLLVVEMTGKHAQRHADRPESQAQRATDKFPAPLHPAILAIPPHG